MKAFPDRFYASPTLQRIVAAGKRGFYDLSSGRPVLDPEVAELIEKPAEPVVLDLAQVRERVLTVLADEARRMLDEGVAQAPMDIDLAMITGAGFQFWNGGITPLLDRTGVAEAVTGSRFLPAGVANAARLTGSPTPASATTRHTSPAGRVAPDPARTGSVASRRGVICHNSYMS